MRFLTHVKDRCEPTNDRPNDKTMQELLAELDDWYKRGLIHLHSPGDGWHYVPGQTDCYFNGRYWYIYQSSSEGAVLVHVRDICTELGLDAMQLQREAYPDEKPSHVTEEDLNACTRAATIEDIDVVLEDLTDINYHSLRAVLESALGACP